MATVLKGSDVANRMKEKMIAETEALKAKGINPGLAIVRIGARPDDLSYERGAIKRSEAVGIQCTVFEFPEDISHADFVNEFKKVNNNPEIHGILLFRPMPKQIDEEEIKSILHPEKDMDCMSPFNIAKLFAGEEGGYAPCTPEAVVETLDNFNIPVEGKNIVIVGRSMVVGKPLSMMLLKKNATVTVCHSKTKDLKGACRKADILVAAIGRARMIDADYVGEGAVVIDVGINVDEAGNLCGDVDYASVETVAGSITPVPGGVGSITSSVLAKHVIQAAAGK